MAETITVGRQQNVDIVQKAPVLPFLPSSMESHSDKVLFLAFDENSRIDTETIALTEWDHYDYYRNEIVKNPIEALRLRLRTGSIRILSIRTRCARRSL